MILLIISSVAIATSSRVPVSLREIRNNNPATPEEKKEDQILIP